MDEPQMDGLYSDEAPKESGNQTVDQENRDNAEYPQFTAGVNVLGHKADEFKPGDEVVFKIVAKEGEDLILQYATGGEGKEREGEDEMDHEMSADDEIDSMSEKGNPSYA